MAVGPPGVVLGVSCFASGPGGAGRQMLTCACTHRALGPLLLLLGRKSCSSSGGLPPPFPISLWPRHCSPKGAAKCRLIPRSSSLKTQSLGCRVTQLRWWELPASHPGSTEKSHFRWAVLSPPSPPHLTPSLLGLSFPKDIPNADASGPAGLGFLPREGRGSSGASRLQELSPPSTGSSPRAVAQK